MIDCLPARGGLRISAFIRDIGDRIEAGDVTFSVRINSLIAHCNDWASDSSITPVVRRRLIADLNRAARNRREIMDGVSLGEFDIEPRVQKIGFTREQYEEVMFSLSGR